MFFTLAAGTLRRLWIAPMASGVEPNADTF